MSTVGYRFCDGNLRIFSSFRKSFIFLLFSEIQLPKIFRVLYRFALIRKSSAWSVSRRFQLKRNQSRSAASNQQIAFQPAKLEIWPAASVISHSNWKTRFHRKFSATKRVLRRRNYQLTVNIRKRLQIEFWKPVINRFRVEIQLAEMRSTKFDAKRPGKYFKRILIAPSDDLVLAWD